MKKYRTFTIKNGTAWAKGKKYHAISSSTYNALKRLKVKEVIWRNGDFITIC